MVIFLVLFIKELPSGRANRHGISKFFTKDKEKAKKKDLEKQKKELQKAIHEAPGGGSDDVQCIDASMIERGKYRKGTSIRQAPVFRHLRALWKSPWKFIIWMNEL